MKLPIAISTLALISFSHALPQLSPWPAVPGYPPVPYPFIPPAPHVLPPPVPIAPLGPYGRPIAPPRPIVAGGHGLGFPGGGVGVGFPGGGAGVGFPGGGAGVGFPGGGAGVGFPGGPGGVGFPGGPGGVGFPGGPGGVGFPGGFPGGGNGSGNNGNGNGHNGNGNGNGNNGNGNGNGNSGNGDGSNGNGDGSNGNGNNGGGNGDGNNGGGMGNSGGNGKGNNGGSNGSGRGVCGLSRGQVAALTPLLKKLGLAQTGNEVKKLVNNIVQSLGDLLSSEGITQLLGTVDQLINGLGLGGLDVKPGVDEIVSILRDAMTAASRLLRPAEKNRMAIRGMAEMWATELPAMATPCDSHSDGLVLDREGSVHLLLHLLDLAYRNGDIDCHTTLSSVCDTATVLTDSREGPGNRGHLWTALLEFGGALIARCSQLDDNERKLALRFAQLAVSVVDLIEPDAQVSVLALIYTLSAGHDCNVDGLVGDLVRTCASSHGVLKEEAGQLVLALYGTDRFLPAGLAKYVYALQSDFSDSVRLIWSQVSCCVDSSAMRPEQHVFAGLKHALHRDVYARQLDAGSKAQGLSMSDAMLVAKVVCDSACTDENLVADIGLSKAALSVILAVSVALGHRHRAPTTIFDVVDWVVGAAASTICKLAVPERQVLSLHLIDAIRSCMARYEAASPGLAAGGLYWVLVLVWHLCALDGSLLLDADHRLLLLKAAVASSNLAFAVFVLQTVLRNHRIPSSDDEPLQRLLDAVPWHLVNGMLGNEAGDAVALLLRLRADEVADVRDALYGIQLCDVGASGAVLDTFDESVDERQSQALVELERVCQVSENRALAVYVESRGGLAMADHLLNRTVCRTLCQVPMLAPWSSFGGVVRRPLSSAADVVSEAVEFATATGAISHGRAVSLLLAAESEGSGCLHQRWELYVKNRIAGAFMEPLVITEADVLASRLFASKIEAGVSANDRMEICFAQRLPTTHTSPVLMEPSIEMFIGDGLEAASSALGGGVDVTKAREALLYVSPWQGPSCEATDALYTHLLMEGSGRIRFTASGTFDPAARLISHMNTCPSSAPNLVTDSLTTNAVRQLAPYIPQLFAMFCYNGPTDTPGCAASALAVLGLLAASAPDLVVFHAVVASRSLPASSKGASRARQLLQAFDAQMVADTCAFLDFSSSIAAPPQDQMRWICVKAKSAHDKAVTAYQQGRFSTERAAAAFSAPLKPAIKMLKELDGKVPQSQAEFEFAGAESALMRMFVWLENRDDHFSTDDDLLRLVEDVWKVIFKTIETASTIPVCYFSPRFAEFTAAVPIPVLTDPTEPLYFERVSENLRVIRSKNSPKMLSFNLSSRDGSVAVRKYILKGNEDLRIDECVMQTFVRLNRVVQGSEETRLAVYNVVPISAYGGLIEVVESAPSLAHIYAQHTAQVAKPGGIQQLYMSHAQPVLKAAGIPNEPFSKWPAEIARLVYDSLLSQAPVDLLYRHMLRSASSPSALYLGLRNMVKSIGMASVAGYILGLGDRHLGNILVSDNGLVNIDFNVCFDFGGSSNVPEQVPFRMSPILEYICGSPNGWGPFALSRVFERSAVATLLFARMDRNTLVAGISRRALFRPFIEWTTMEESWLRDRSIDRWHGGSAEVLMPRCMPLAAATLWSQAHVVSAEDFVRGTGLCPPRAFWPRSVADQAVTEIPYGWRIAQGAVARVDARLDYQGVGGTRSQSVLVGEQFRIAWETAASKERLSKMYMGWAPWV
ncbi:hypothetical protein IW146_004987 [Coemansia sp. RSA 922]|nr:hypothetical protein IW146_004987 [Coemansia sp. RSA 922]